jgi:hypothetical protein
LLKRLYFLHLLFWVPLSKIWPWMHGFISGSSILIHCCSSLFLCQYHAVLMLQLFSAVCSLVLWCLQHWTFCSELLWLLEVFCVSICILLLLFIFLCIVPLEFW